MHQSLMRSEVFNLIGFAGEQVLQTFLLSQRPPYYGNNLMSSSISKQQGVTSSYHQHSFTCGMKTPDDPKDESFEKRLPFRKRPYKRHIFEQQEPSSSQSSDVPLNLIFNETGKIDTKNIRYENQDSSDTSSDHSVDKVLKLPLPQRFESENRTCDNQNSEQEFGDTTLLVINSEETKSQEEEPPIIPLTVENLPSTSRGYTRKEPLNCPHCNKKFHHKGDMKKHIRIHTKDRPYSCEYCSENFQNTSNLHRHQRSKHTKEEPYSCNKCNKSFSRSDKLKLHQKVVENINKRKCFVLK
ncbi:hypothetical protein HHI36_017251 [Cryptolaemus montrouzieri]|uniref:C2H2-type domain-containing protein n=1 Tax=Cryptolaemus montrouzieri TaxID=559131 RepID=A0ABD2NMC9_9CUCU